MPIPDLPSVPFTFRYRHIRNYIITCSGILKAWQSNTKQVVAILEYRLSPSATMFSEHKSEANDLAMSSPELHIPIMFLESVAYSESMLRAFITLRTNEIDYLADFPTARAGVAKLPVAKPFRKEAQAFASRLALYKAESTIRIHQNLYEQDNESDA